MTHNEAVKQVGELREAIDYISQDVIERRYNRKHIDIKIREELLANDLVVAKMQEGVERVRAYIDGQYYASKMARIEGLKTLEIDQLVEDIFVGIAYFQKPELFTSVTAQLAGRLGFDDKTAAITTMAELVGVLCFTDLFDIDKPGKYASLHVVSKLPLSEGLIHFIETSAYLPPMVCEPRELTSNLSSGYLSHNDSLILGKGNHHEGDICLDVLNTLNRQVLSLDLDFLCKVEEDMNSELKTLEQYEEWVIEKQMKNRYPCYQAYLDAMRQQWMDFKTQSYRFYDLMATHGNRFHLTHKVDKRGRVYAQGYHITTQGTAFKKAMISFADEEVVTGAP